LPFILDIQVGNLELLGVLSWHLSSYRGIVH
jgi:hypothetical protein